MLIFERACGLCARKTGLLEVDAVASVRTALKFSSTVYQAISPPKEKLREFNVVQVEVCSDCDQRVEIRPWCSSVGNPYWDTSAPQLQQHHKWPDLPDA